MSLENNRLVEDSTVGEFSILKYVKSEILVNLWLAAYFEKRIKKKQLMSININESVQEIIKITNSENEWIPLRISCGLLSGVVKLFYHKVEYLDNKCTTVFTKMQNFNKSLHNNVNDLSSSKVFISKETNSKIDRPQNNTRHIRSVIDIEDINRTLDEINDDSIDQLEIVPLSQASERSGNQNFELTLSQRSEHHLNHMDSVPLMLDMEFDDFINHEEKETRDLEMVIEDRMIMNEAGVEIDLEASIEKRRGASINFEEIITHGIEEIGSIGREKPSENGSSGNLLDMDDHLEYRGSISTFRASPISNTNRDSIGGFSAALDVLQDSGNRLSISAVTENALGNSSGLLSNLPISAASEISRSVKVSEAYNRKVGTKRMKVIEIAQDFINHSRPLENSDKSLSIVFSNSKSDAQKLTNLISINKSSEMGILSLCKTLPIRLSNESILRFNNNGGRKLRNIKKRAIQKTNESSFEIGSIERTPNSTIDAYTSLENYGDHIGQETNGNFGFEEQDLNEEFEIETPVRGKKLQSQEDDKNELIFTPWTNYLGTEQRKITNTSPNTFYDDDKRIQSLFSSREVKTMQYLNSKFSTNEQLSFDELVKGSDASVVAPIFVQILHLKSKSMIDIRQKEPFGEITIFPVLDNSQIITFN